MKGYVAGSETYVNEFLQGDRTQALTDLPVSEVEGVDRAALKDLACCSRFKAALRSIKPPLWSVSVDEHERFASSVVRRAAKAAFGTPAKRPRREHIDDAAWALICDRRTIKTRCRERRVSAASRGMVPGRTPGLLFVFMWASGRGDSAPLAGGSRPREGRSAAAVVALRSQPDDIQRIDPSPPYGML